MTQAPMTTTPAIQPPPDATRPGLRMRSLNSGAGPVRMTRIALPNAALQISRVPTPADDTFAPSPANTPKAPNSPSTAHQSEPITPPAMRSLPGRLRMRALHADAGPPAMVPLPASEPLRMRALTDAAGPAIAPTRSAARSSAGGFAAPTFGTGLSAQRSFSEALGAASRSDALAAREERSEHAKAREAAEKLIATTLVEPILKQLRETNNAAPPFGTTPAEKQFGSLLDHRLSQDIVKSANFPIVDRVARDLLRNLGDKA